MIVIRTARRWALAPLLLGGIASGCGLPDPGAVDLPPPPAGPRTTGTIGRKVTVPISCPVKPPDPSRSRVMVVDTGFDLRHPIFRDKLAGCYEIECPPSAGFDVSVVESDDERAARYIAYLGEPGPACTLKEGLTLEVDSYLEEFDPQARAEWDATLLAKGRFDASWDVDTLLDATGSGDYHGTATAGAIAYQNDVDIVAVQIKLGTFDDVASKIPCITQADIDRETRILSRNDVAEAYAAAPLEADERLLMDLRRTHGVRVENHSFGPISNATYQRLLAARCAPVTFEQNTLAQTELDARRLEAQRAKGVFDGTDVLTFQSSGNYADKIDDGGDTPSCTPRRTDRLLVGAYEIYREKQVLTAFSNYGDCVDAYALGANVLLPSANGFYGVFSGTSFSSPLAARYASLLASASPTATSLRDQVVTIRDENRFLPTATMPVELNFHSWTPADAAVRQPLTLLRFEPERRSRMRMRE